MNERRSSGTFKESSVKRRTEGAMAKGTIKYTVCILMVLALVCIPVVPGPSLAQQPAGETIRVTYKFAVPEITQVGEYHSVTIEGLPKLQEPGLPKLPIKGASILIPFGRRAKLEELRVTCGNKVRIEGKYVVELGQEPVPIGYTGPVTPTLPSPEVYGSSEPFPGVLMSKASIQKRRGYDILIFTLYPVEYIPQEGQLSYYEYMTVEVDTEPAPETSDRMLRRDPGHWAEDRKEIREMVDNPEAAESYPRPDEMRGREGTLLDPGTPYDYVIITNQALEGAPGPNNFQALRDAKQARGISATIVTTEWIYANYSGTRPDGGTDNQTRIRNFIIDAYQTWGTSYVLLGGDGDGADVGGESGDEIIPHRGFYVDAGESTDYDIPADMYYGCLDGTFDNDGDGIYGEPTDGEGGGEVDLFAEVYVGRAAVDSEEELSNFIAKTLAYEGEDDQYLRNVWTVGEYLGFGGDADWGCNSKDDIKDGSSAAGYTTIGFENSPYASFFDTASLCDRDYPGNDWPKSEIINVINSPAHIINHLGHANVTYVMKMGNSDVDSSLTNDHYFIGYSQGCYDGSFDNRYSSGSYSSSDSISEHLTTEVHGAVAFVSNSRYGWGYVNDPQGPSHYYDRQFWDAILGEGIFNLGWANQDSKEDTYALFGPGGFGWVFRWVYYELNLFGDPELRVKTTAGPPPDIEVSPMSLRCTAPPGGSDTQILTIGNVGAGNLHYSISKVYVMGPGTAGSGGPDDYGYTWIDSDEPGGPTYDWVEISGVGTALSLGDDDYEEVSLPFTFNFYGQDKTTVKISSNGYLTFGGDGTDYSNDPIPDSLDPNDFIAPFWDDLDPDYGSQGEIYYYYDTANQRFIVEYKEVQHFPSGNPETFEVILYADGSTVYQYQTVSNVTSCTVGIENSDGSDGLQVVYNSSYLHDGLAVKILRPIDWLSFDPDSGTVLPSDSTDITVTCDASELDTGTYVANLIIANNDPDENPVTVPVNLTVSSSNLLSNASFEVDSDGDGIPDHWSGSSLASQDRRDGSYAKAGSYSFKITGASGVYKNLRQRISLSGDASKRFLLSGWSRAESTDPGGGYYGLTAGVRYSDGTTGWFSVPFTKSSHDWQYVERVVVPSKPFSAVDVYLLYYDQAGTAWFDAVQLYGGKLEAPTSQEEGPVSPLVESVEKELEILTLLGQDESAPTAEELKEPALVPLDTSDPIQENLVNSIEH